MLVDNVVILFCTKIETMVIVLVIRFYMQIGKGTFNVNFFFWVNDRLFDAEKTLQLHLRLDYTTKQGLSY